MFRWINETKRSKLGNLSQAAKISYCLCKELAKTMPYCNTTYCNCVAHNMHQIFATLLQCLRWCNRSGQTCSTYCATMLKYTASKCCVHLARYCNHSSISKVTFFRALGFFFAGFSLSFPRLITGAVESRTLWGT